MPKVFVTHAHPKLRQSLSLAESYGEVVFLTTEEYQPEPTVGQWNDSIKTAISNRLKMDYIPGEDYILVAGSPVCMLIAGMALYGYKNRTHKILKWNGQQQRYELCLV